MLINRKNNPPNPLNPRFIVPVISIKQTGIPKYFGKIPNQELSFATYYGSAHLTLQRGNNDLQLKIIGRCEPELYSMNINLPNTDFFTDDESFDQPVRSFICTGPGFSIKVKFQHE